jgi:excisionase family DNA binding protein
VSGRFLGSASGDDDELASVRRRALAIEQACGALADEIARLIGSITEVVERPPIVPLSVSVDDAALLLGLSRSNLFKLLESGEIRSVKVGSRRLVPRKALDEFLAGRDTSAVG